MSPANPATSEQPELPFAPVPSGPDGYQLWKEQQQALVREASRVLGLPLGREVAVELRDGVRLRGVLRFAEDGLFIEVSREKAPLLRIDRCTFHPREIVSCARLD